MRFTGSLRALSAVLVAVALIGLAGCGKSDDPTGPEDPTPTPTPAGPTATPTAPPATPTPTPGEPGTFPATYQGQYWFDNLPYSGQLIFTVAAERSLTGTWQGQDLYGNSWTLTLEGWVRDGQIHIGISGWYNVVPCEVTGAADGVSGDNYQSFNGSWSASECHGLTIRGGWWANRVN